MVNIEKIDPIDYFVKNFYTSNEYLQHTMLYNERFDLWFKWNEDYQCYRDSSKGEISKVVYDWMKNHGFTKNTKVKHNLMDIIKADKSIKLSDFNDRIWVLKNGYYFMDEDEFVEFDKIHDHVKRYLLPNLYEPLIFNDDIDTIPPELESLCNALNLEFKSDTIISSMKHPNPATGSEPSDVTMWLRFLVNLVHLNPVDRIMPVLVGLPSAGKSPNVRLIQAMLPNSTGIVRYCKIGENGEVQDVWRKPIWLDEEGSMGFATNKTLKLIKTNFSRNSLISIRNLYQGAFTTKGGRFIVAATNQAFQMSDKYNQTGTFKRICPLFMPHVFKMNDEFEEQFEDEELLSRIFSYLLKCKVTKMNDGFEQIKFQERNMEVWNWSAYPIKRICDELFYQSYEIDSELLETIVCKRVKAEMIDKHCPIPPLFMQRVRETLERLGCKHISRKSRGLFIGIKAHDEDIQRNSIMAEMGD